MLLAFQDRRKLFMVVIVVGWRGREAGGGVGLGGLLNKNVGLKLAKKHWLKALKKTPQKTLDQNKNDSKSHIWNSFFEILFQACNFFYICLHVPVDLIRIIFNSRFSSIKSQSQQKLAKKFAHFIVQFRSKSLIHLMNLKLNLNDIENNMLPQHSKKSFFTLQIFQETCFCLVSEKQFAEMVQYYFLTPKSCNNS